MELRPQDVVVVLKLLASGTRTWTYSQLGEELSLSPSQVFRSVDRAEIARLLQQLPVPPLNQHFATSFEPPPVWPYADGSVRGTEFSPLYKNAPKAASDPKLYELLALVDAIRDGRAREREVAIRELTARIDAQ